LANQLISLLRIILGQRVSLGFKTFVKTVQKIRIDTYAGMPLVWVTALFYRFRRLFVSEKKDIPVRRIVVCKLMGMGTILQSTPLLITLKENFPGAELLFLSAAGIKRSWRK
jgi:hypothetical protein